MDWNKIETRFWRGVQRGKPDACWEWHRARSGAGYGHFGVDKVLLDAHRVSYQLVHGRRPIPKGKHVLHTCDIRACVNPAHLFLGTPADNMNDCYAKGRNPRQRGSAHVKAVLTGREVSQIRQRLKEGVTQASIARDFSVSPSTIHMIAYRVSWRHVP